MEAATLSGVGEFSAKKVESANTPPRPCMSGSRRAVWSDMPPPIENPPMITFESGIPKSTSACTTSLTSCAILTMPSVSSGAAGARSSRSNHTRWRPWGPRREYLRMCAVGNTILTPGREKAPSVAASTHCCTPSPLSPLPCRKMTVARCSPPPAGGGVTCSSRGRRSAGEAACIAIPRIPPEVKSARGLEGFANEENAVAVRSRIGQIPTTRSINQPSRGDQIDDFRQRR
mmetsp:Transcript_24967/g.59564  ORF Transcript_24967/g.59564 Transcript_24967/m.59564 type:complete len:231 (-) Transcript_24967:30-722(-)